MIDILLTFGVVCLGIAVIFLAHANRRNADSITKLCRAVDSHTAAIDECNKSRRRNLAGWNERS